MADKTKRLLNRINKSRPQVKTPISDDMFLPNHSGIKNHPEAKNAFWTTDTNQTGITGNKTGTFNLTTTGEGGFGGLMPYDSATYDLGSVGLRWRSLFLSADANVGGDINVTGTVDGIDIATDVAANTTHRGLVNPHIDWTNASENFKTSGTGEFSNIGIGLAPSTAAGINLSKLNALNANYFGLNLTVTQTVAAAATLAGIQGLPQCAHSAGTQGASVGGLFFPCNNTAGGTVTTSIGTQIFNAVNSGGGTLTNVFGLKIEDITAGATNNFSIFTGSAMSHFGGNVGIGTVAPTQPLSIEEKCGMTAIGGFAIKLTNKTGSNTVQGQIVKPDNKVDGSGGVNDAFITISANDQEIIGIVLEAGVSDGSEAWVVISGIADVLMDAGGSARGDRIISSATAGSGDVWNVGGAVATHFQEIGHCIETRVGTGLARCVLHFN